MKYIILIIFFPFSMNLMAQDSTYYKYSDLINKAKEYEKQGKQKNALIFYDNAFKLIDFVPYDYFDAFSLSIEGSNYLKANEYLVKGTLHGLDLSGWNAPEVKLFNKSSYAKKYLEIKDSLLNIHFKSIDIEYYNSLQEMKKLDQSIRQEGNKQMAFNDSVNFDKLISLSNEKGFPTFQKTGYGCNIALLILLHNVRLSKNLTMLC